MVAIGPPGLSQIRPLPWPAPLTRGFCKGLRDRTWHVLRAIDRSETDIVFPPFRRLERIFVCPDPASCLGSRGENT